MNLNTKLLNLERECLKLADKSFKSKRIRYGTSGFRFPSHNMYYISFRLGIFMTYLSYKHSPQPWGIIFTASHNQYLDNGVKIIDHQGHMLNFEYEKILEEFVNNQNLSEAVSNLMIYLKIKSKF